MATPDLLPQGPALSFQCLQAAAILLQAGSPLPLSTGMPLDQAPQVPILSLQGLQGSRCVTQNSSARLQALGQDPSTSEKTRQGSAIATLTTSRWAALRMPGMIMADAVLASTWEAQVRYGAQRLTSRRWMACRKVLRRSAARDLGVDGLLQSCCTDRRPRWARSLQDNTRAWSRDGQCAVLLAHANSTRHWCAGMAAGSCAPSTVLLMKGPAHAMPHQCPAGWAVHSTSHWPWGSLTCPVACLASSLLQGGCPWQAWSPGLESAPPLQAGDPARVPCHPPAAACAPEAPPRKALQMQPPQQPLLLLQPCRGDPGMCRHAQVTESRSAGAAAQTLQRGCWHSPPGGGQGWRQLQCQVCLAERKGPHPLADPGHQDAAPWQNCWGWRMWLPLPRQPAAGCFRRLPRPAAAQK